MCSNFRILYRKRAQRESTNLSKYLDECTTPYTTTAKLQTKITATHIRGHWQVTILGCSLYANMFGVLPFGTTEYEELFDGSIFVAVLSIHIPLTLANIGTVMAPRKTANYHRSRDWWIVTNSYAPSNMFLHFPCVDRNIYLKIWHILEWESVLSEASDFIWLLGWQIHPHEATSSFEVRYFQAMSQTWCVNIPFSVILSGKQKIRWKLRW